MLLNSPPRCKIILVKQETCVRLEFFRCLRSLILVFVASNLWAQLQNKMQIFIWHLIFSSQATSALDTATERNIQASLNNIAYNRSTLVVAHRLSTIVHADEILMMHQGEIIERGTHAELLTIPNGRYAALWRAQSEANSSAVETDNSREQNESPKPMAPTHGPVNLWRRWGPCQNEDNFVQYNVFVRVCMRACVSSSQTSIPWSWY